MYYGAHYDGPCNGHYYWFIPTEYLDYNRVSKNVEGIIKSKIGMEYNGYAKNC
jgi:hypothetical protein